MWSVYRVRRLGPPDWERIEISPITSSAVFVRTFSETVPHQGARGHGRVRFKGSGRASRGENRGAAAQIDPHFLFNSLETRAYLHPRGRDGAAASTDKLARVSAT